MTADDLAKMLSDNGLRNTADRRRVLALFMKDKAWTVAQVHECLEGADLSTAYRNVNALVEHGLLKMASVQGKETYYELARKGHHAHRICRRCGKALCIPCPMNNATDEHALEIYSLCADCSGGAR